MQRLGFLRKWSYLLGLLLLNQCSFVISSKEVPLDQTVLESYLDDKTLGIFWIHQLITEDFSSSGMKLIKTISFDSSQPNTRLEKSVKTFYALQLFLEEDVWHFVPMQECINLYYDLKKIIHKDAKKNHLEKAFFCISGGEVYPHLLVVGNRAIEWVKRNYIKQS